MAETMKDHDVDFEVVNAVNESWDTIKRIPNYEDVAGELLFRKIFELAPPALKMFRFGAGFRGDDDALYQSIEFRSHAKAVVKMLDVAIDMLGPDLEVVSKSLGDLGARHVVHGVLPAHYGIVGEALIHTLQTALGVDGWTEQVEKGWTMVYSFVSTAMIAGANSRLLSRFRRRRSSLSFQGTVESSPPNESMAKLSYHYENTEQVCPQLLMIENIISNEIRGSDEFGDDMTMTTSSTDSVDEGDIIYMKIVEDVYTSWDIVKAIPDYTKVAGTLLFKNIFEIAPQAKGLFPFAKDYADDDEALFSDPGFLIHAKGVVSMLDVAVNLLGPDLEPVTNALEELGARHQQYNVVPEHYPIVGEALLKTLEAALGDNWTPTVKEGWTAIYSFVSTSMQRGARRIQEQEGTHL